jgi:hypothetical protein
MGIISGEEGVVGLESLTVFDIRSFSRVPGFADNLFFRSSESRS